MIRYLARALYEAIKEEERLSLLMDEAASTEEQNRIQPLLDQARRDVAKLRHDLDLKKMD